VAAAMASLADGIIALENAPLAADAPKVLEGLQTVFGMIAALVPRTAGTLQSASTLFGQVNTLLGQFTLEVKDIAAISQQVTAIAPLFPPA
jgi:hypothetical protein